MARRTSPISRSKDVSGAISGAKQLERAARRPADGVRGLIDRLEKADESSEPKRLERPALDGERGRACRRCRPAPAGADPDGRRGTAPFRSWSRASIRPRGARPAGRARPGGRRPERSKRDRARPRQSGRTPELSACRDACATDRERRRPAPILAVWRVQRTFNSTTPAARRGGRCRVGWLSEVLRCSATCTTKSPSDGDSPG